MEWRPCSHVRFWENYTRFSSGYAARGRKFGIPKLMPLVVLTEGPGALGVWNSKSRPYRKRSSLRNVGVKLDVHLPMTVPSWTPSEPSCVLCRFVDGAV